MRISIAFLALFVAWCLISVEGGQLEKTPTPNEDCDDDGGSKNQSDGKDNASSGSNDDDCDDDKKGGKGGNWKRSTDKDGGSGGGGRGKNALLKLTLDDLLKLKLLPNH